MKRVLFLVSFILLLPLISAGFFDFLKDIGMTGMGTSGTTTVTIPVGANNPNITFVSLNNSVTISEGGIRYLEVSFLAEDVDDNLENESAMVNVTKIGDLNTYVVNNSCGNFGLANNLINYSCVIEIPYWYDAGSYEVSAEINDTSNKHNQNFTYWDLQETTGMNISSSALTWATIIPSEINATSNNDPITLENTGNKDTLSILVQGISLAVDDGGATEIGANNFSVFNGTSNDVSPDVECEFTNQSAAITFGVQPAVLLNDTDMLIVLNALPRGGGDLATRNETLYFCLFEAGSDLTSSTYSTGGTGNEEDWTISVN